MQIETPPSEKPYEKPEGERRGIVIVNTGDGKGKSTAAFGLALRAHGRGKAVKIYQFMKVPTARFGEHRAFEWLAERQFGTPPGRSQGGPAPLGGSDPHSGGAWGHQIIEGLGDGFSWKSQDLERSAQLARDGWEKARSTILGGEHFLVVLDEITYPLIYGWLPLDAVLQTLRERPSHVHVCLTGRRCPPEIIELADTVTEMTKIKHAFNAGIPAQRGIED
ncbi:MAG: cob(I)yrinic acid a,c-diamide adenosyltransferase [Burkholderiaceae bacterium]|nr:cob(I)yrinic acid a,c-diamide adenosyltransferase [Burkholderiaceae bacterium]